MQMKGLGAGQGGKEGAGGKEKRWELQEGVFRTTGKIF